MASLAEQMVAAGKEKAEKRKGKGAVECSPCDQPRYVHVEAALNGFTLRFNVGNTWESKNAVATNAKEVGDAIAAFLGAAETSSDKK